MLRGTAFNFAIFSNVEMFSSYCAIVQLWHVGDLNSYSANSNKEYSSQ